MTTHDDAVLTPEAERALRGALGAVAVATPVRPALGEVLARAEAADLVPTGVIGLDHRRRRRRRLGVAAAAAAAVVAVGMVAFTGDETVQTGPADPGSTASNVPSTTAPPASSPALGAETMALLDPAPAGYEASYSAGSGTPGYDGPLASRLLRWSADDSEVTDAILVVQVTRQELDASETGGVAPIDVDGVPVYITPSPDGSSEMVTWEWVAPDGTPHGVLVTITRPASSTTSRTAEELVGGLVHDPLVDEPEVGLGELSAPLFRDPVGPSALYRGDGDAIVVALYPLGVDELTEGYEWVGQLSGQTIARTPIEVDGRPAWVLTGSGGGVVVAVELPSGRSATVSGASPDQAAAFAATVVEVPVAEGFDRLGAEPPS